MRTGPNRGCSADALNPNSDMRVNPSGTIPVATATADVSLSDLDLSIPAGGSASDEINLSEFQLGTVKPDLGPQSIQGVPVFESEKDVQFDDLSLPAGFCLAHRLNGCDHPSVAGE